MPVGHTTRVRRGLDWQGSRMLTNGGRKHIVAPLNQLVDERYTVYNSVVDEAGGGKAAAAHVQRKLARNKAFTNACFTICGLVGCGLLLLPMLWAIFPVFEATGTERRWAEAERRQRATASATGVSGSSAASSTARTEQRQHAERQMAAVPGMEPIAAADIYGAGEASPREVPAVCTVGGALEVPQAVACDALRQVAAARSDAQKIKPQQLHALSSRLSGPLRQRHAYPGVQPTTVNASASDDSSAAEDAATSCGSFELLGPAG